MGGLQVADAVGFDIADPEGKAAEFESGWTLLPKSPILPDFQAPTVSPFALVV
ncbi:hypothetical protein [Spongiactinospora rosea]|nr:hypothetical protein [Spongiactinospora rosea]